MTNLSAAQQSQVYTELTEATSEGTAEVIMHSIVDTPWDDIVTNDRLDARFAQVDARFAQVDARFSRLEGHIDARFAQVDARFAEMKADMEKSLRANTFRILTTIFAFNGALVAIVAAIH